MGDAGVTFFFHKLHEVMKKFQDKFSPIQTVNSLTPCCLSDALRSPLLLVRGSHCVRGNLSSSACLLPAVLKSGDELALRFPSAVLLLPLMGR